MNIDGILYIWKLVCLCPYIVYNICESLTHFSFNYIYIIQEPPLILIVLTSLGMLNLLSFISGERHAVMRDCNDFSLFQIEFVWLRIYYIYFFSKASCV